MRRREQGGTAVLGSSVGPLLLLWSLCVACGTSGVRDIPDANSRYDNLLPEEMRRFDAARRDQEAGRLEEARAVLAELAARDPDNIPVGIWLQEADIALAASPTGDGLEVIRQRERKRAEDEPTVRNLVLAARLEPDPIAAAVLLEKGEKLDKACAWCAYARAWLAARSGDWGEVRAQVQRAREADPGHMPTRWLEIWMLARSGSVAEASASLETWIEKARGDLRLDPRLVREAELDRALLAVLDGDAREAKKLLALLDDPRLDQGRKQMVAAAAEQATSDPRAALAAAAKAEALHPGEILPMVQQALLYEYWLNDAQAAEAAWARVLALSRASPALDALLELFRARVMLERLQSGHGEDPAKARAAPGVRAGL